MDGQRADFMEQFKYLMCSLALELHCEGELTDFFENVEAPEWQLDQEGRNDQLALRIVMNDQEPTRANAETYVENFMPLIKLISEDIVNIMARMDLTNFLIDSIPKIMKKTGGTWPKPIQKQ